MRYSFLLGRLLIMSGLIMSGCGEMTLQKWPSLLPQEAYDRPVYNSPMENDSPHRADINVRIIELKQKAAKLNAATF